MGQFEEMIVASWEAKGKAKVVIPAAKVTEGFKNRLVLRRRPNRAGAKIDNTSNDPRTFRLECVFHNDSEEPDIPLLAYPDELDKLLASFEVKSTGTLTLPTRGPLRCQLDSYERVEDSAMRDCATLVLNFVEDNEDATTGSSFRPPSARTMAVTQASLSTDALQAAGAWGDFVSSLQEFASGLEAIANAPGDFMDTLDARVSQVCHAVDRVEGAFADAGNKVSGELTSLLVSPEHSFAGRSLRKLSDTAARARLGFGAGGDIVVRKYTVTLSIFEIGQRESQPGAALMSLNPGIADFFRIPAGTPVRVRSSPA